MRWFNTPPCAYLEVREASAERLVLVGPTASARIAGGTATAIGGLFASLGLHLLRLAVPAPLKLLPMAFTAVGSGMAAAGAGSAFGGCSVEVTSKGLVLRWKLPARAERAVRIAAADVEDLEVQAVAHSDLGASRQTLEYRLAVVTGGHRLPFEAHAAAEQALARKAEVLRRLRGPPPELRPPTAQPF